MNKKLYSLAYIYISIPIILFLVGFLKWYIGIPCAILAVVTLFSMCRDVPDNGFKIPMNRETIEKILFVGFLVFLWVYLSGIGAMVDQNGDHRIRNGIYEALLNYSWPVKALAVDANYNVGERGLIYYLGFWLPSAFIGKITRIEIGYMFQIVWAWLGIMLLYLLICEHLKCVKAWPMIVFMGFSGLDFLGYLLLRFERNEIWAANRLEWWTYRYQFSSFTSQLFYVFNQAIPIWIAFMLVLRQRHNKYIAVLLGMTFISSALPVVGAVPLALCLVMSRKYVNNGIELSIKNSAWWKIWAKDTFSWQNVCGGLIPGLITGLYYLGNGSGKTISASVGNDLIQRGIERLFIATDIGALNSYKVASLDPVLLQAYKDAGLSYRWYSGSFKGDIFIYLMFILLDALVYYFAIYKYQKNNPLMYVSLIWLLICPKITLGVSADFCMRASIPALMVLYLFVVDALRESARLKDRVIQISLIVMLSIGSLTAVHEVWNQTSEMYKDVALGDSLMQNSMQIDALLFTDNFAGSTDGFFFKYLAK